MAKGGDKKRVICPEGFDLRPLQVMEFIGFELEIVTPTCIQGRFVVSERSAQAHGVLHGGISAFIAESLGSLGAFVVCGFQPVAGVDLSISHLRAAPIGLEIEAKATPVHIGGMLHVELRFLFLVGIHVKAYVLVN
ncbi:1,4-dihydroxy-2-naphthoyl-CoA thioesterase 1-like isoform X2 [Cryptomeria japonica]|uniref:1,4-dihydroxy-2-naphthoyl-CoA thioesterase 1-like isoform X2 n=1 Tax=Cryptomeria japonica TaxID=3369 RepID=UPI0025ABC990|nr:1,4-dihydroxy-2-naphthoyl-CoA thioesterase 1-like isoform X2 [Cryptomeria japonica]